MKKALMLTYESYQDHEVIYPYYRLLEEEYEVEIMSNKVGRIHGILGTYMHSARAISDLSDEGNRKYFMGYDMLVIPGGVKALEYLRQEQNVLSFIREWDEANKTIACICHGAQLLISSKVVKGREISGYYSIKDDINNAGANYVDAPAVVSRNIVTSPHYKHMGPWMKAAINLVQNGL